MRGTFPSFRRSAYLVHTVSLLLLLFGISASQVAHAQVTAGFTANTVEGCSPLTVQFAQQSTGGATTFLWNFGNGNTSNLANPGVIYINPGTYTVTLIVSDGNTSDTLVQTNYITVFADPQPDFTVNQTSGCAPLTVTFSDNTTIGDAPIDSYLWDFGDGNVSNDPNPTHTYQFPGSFDITLVVTDTNGCSNSFIQNDLVTTTQAPNGSIAWSSPQSCQIPYSVNFTSSVTPAGTYGYEWDFGDGGTSTQPNPGHTYTAAGIYTVSLIISDPGGCADTIIAPNAIQLDPPVAAFSVPSNSACVGETVTFINNSIGGATFFWDYGDGTTYSGPMPQHVYQTPGSYDVTLITTNSAGCQDTLVQSAFMTVGESPSAQFMSSDPLGCEVPFVVNFTDTSSNVVAWTWDFGDGTTANVSNPSHVYTTPGFYSITLIVENANGCTDTLNQPNYVQIVRPTAAFVPDSVAGCIPLSVDFLDLSVSPNDSITNWIWDFGDGGSSFIQSPNHVYNAVGLFESQLIVQTATGCRDTAVYQFIEAGVPATVQFAANPVIVCAEDPVSFLDQSNVGTDWEWSFGDGGFSQLQNPTHQYGDTGTFDVVLIVENYGCLDTLVKPDYIQVLGPIADFFMTPTTGCEVPLNVNLTDASLMPHTWYWDFGDGNSDTTQNTSHTYTANGTYDVTLVVTNDSTGCASSATQTINIFPPVANFTASSPNGCTGQLIDFSNNSTNAVSYFWDFGDGDTSTVANPSHLYSTPGNFDVTLIVQNADGCLDTMIVNNVVNITGPIADFTVNTTDGCAPLGVLFTSTATTVPATSNITGWQWDFGDGNTSNAQNPAHTYQTPGSFDVTLVVSDNLGCTDTLVQPGMINPTFPSAAFTTNDTTICPGGLVSFTNQSTGFGITYQWDFGDGTSSAVQDPVHVYPTNQGTYTVSLTVTDVNGCVSTTSVNDLVSVGPPTANFFAAPTQQNCPPLNVSFTDQSSANATQWFWDFGDGSTSTLPNPNKIYGLPGDYTVTLIVQTAQGCRDTLVMDDLIDLSGPEGSFTFTPLAGCSPLEVDFTATTVGAVNWTWDFGDGALGFGQTTSHIYTQDTIAFPTLVVEDTAGCVLAIQASDSIVVQAGPIPGLTIDVTQTCTGQTVSFTDQSFSAVPITQYIWDFGDGTGSSNPNPQHVYAGPGTYPVNLTVINANGCVDSLNTPLNISVNTPPTASFVMSTNSGCSPLPVSFSDSSQGVVPIVDWQWDFGDGNTATGGSPNHVFTTPGLYTIQLVITDFNGCVDSISQIVTVAASPVVDFIVSSQVGCAPKDVQFTDLTTSSNAIATWFWDFGDGNTSNAQNPLHQYQVNGQFDVGLTVTDVNGCVGTNLKPDLVVLSPPTAAFVSNVAPGCPPLASAFNANPSNGDTTLVDYFWDFGDGTTGTGSFATHVYYQTGTFDITLVVTDALGCQDTLVDTAHVQINTPPVADLTLSDSFLCAPATLDAFSNSTAGGSPIFTYSIDFGNGIVSNSPNASSLYAVPGSYTVTHIVSDVNGCSDTLIKPVVVYDPPTAAISVSDSVGCASSAFQFIGENPPPSLISSFQWDFGDGTTSNLQFPSHSFGANGSYDVTLWVTDVNGCTDSLTEQDLVVISGPQADFVPDSIKACPGVILNFADASTSDTTIVDWLWDFGDGNSDNTPNPTHSYATSGSYDVTLTISDANGCTQTVTKPGAVSIYQLPTADFLLSDIAGCLPFDLTLSDTSQAGDAPLVNFFWDFGNGNNFAGQTAMQNYSTAGIYDITLTVTDQNGCSDSEIKSIEVYDLPVTDFQASETQGCAPKAINFTSTTSGPVGVSTWSWSFGDGGVSSAANPTHFYGVNGYYDITLVVTDANGCKDSLTKPSFILFDDPQVSFTLSDTTACEGALVSFTDQSVSDTTFSSWFWEFGDGGLSAEQHPTHAYTSPGTYTVILTATDSLGCSASDTLIQAVQVWDPPTANFARSDTAGCAPLTVSFGDISTGVGVAISGWNWDLGNFNQASNPNPVSTYLNPGMYDIELVATDARGCTDTIVKQVEVYGPPSTNFIASKTLLCVGEQVDFTDLSGGLFAMDTWLWDFGDGNISNLQNPTHAYQAAGFYTVTLVAFDVNGCVDTLIAPNLIEVTEPTAQFATINSPGCPGTTVSFTDQSIADTTLVGWLWEFGTGDSSTLPVPSYTYSQSGLYDVSLTVTNLLGCTHTVTVPQAVEIYQTPEAAFTVPSLEGCVPYVLDAQDATPVNAITQWVWLLDGQVTASGPLATFLLDSVRTYELSLAIVDGNGCPDTATQTITVNPTPNVDFGASDTVGCAPAIIIFSDSTPGLGISYEWSFGDGNGDNVQNPIHTYAEDGDYSIQLVVTDINGCVDSLIKEDFIHLSRPEGDFVVQYTPDCPPIQATFTATSNSPRGIESFYWNTGDGNTAYGNPYIHTYLDTGTYDISLVLRDSLGCETTIDKPAEVAVYGVRIPDPVTIHYVTVLNDEDVRIAWEPVLEDDFGVYLLYREDVNNPGTWILIHETPSAFDTLFVDAGAGVLNTRLNSYCYKVTHRNYCGTEGSLNAARTHCTIEVEANPIPDRIVLNWNHYQGWNEVDHYEIFRAPSYNTAAAQFLDIVPGFVNAYVDSATNCFNSYTYRVEAVGMEPLHESWSDTTHAINQKSEPSQATDLIRATVENNEDILIEWEPFIMRDITDIFLEKSADNGSNWLTVAQLPPTDVQYLDTEVNVQESPYTYRLVAKDSCGFTSPYSNIGTTILLEARTENFVNYLNWTPYFEWAGDVDFYEIQLYHQAAGDYIQVGVVNNQQLGYTDTTFIDQSEYCYRIVAHERGGRRATSFSNEVCVPITPRLEAPNAFTPNGDGTNEYFTFRGIYINTFEVQIFDRWGELIFQSNSLFDSWDGRYKGMPAPEGVYVYKVVATANDGKPFLLSGSITLLR
ncbi:PKD domain-containing protein [Pontibacter sp. G13]|uniref:PKD domain-containing protein n=1 Tax=Pontibacter sp. G13 TaxID=3074898 RepID=UPI00288A8C54|nr:PKD domain-containing protein [Pontibacter sp. G13]WNJ18160.1 PKD domain-containing protein [Pontibacter sp. G13]